MIEPGHAELSVRRQCEIIGLARSSLYYEPGSESAENLALMRQIDEQYLKTPFYGSRKMAFTFNINCQDHGLNFIAFLEVANCFFTRLAP